MGSIYEYILNTAKLTFNNSDLFSEMDGEYFEFSSTLHNCVILIHLQNGI